MVGPGFMDGLDTDISGDFFDHIDDLLDFPNEELEGLAGGNGDGDGLGSVWPPTGPDVLASTSAFSGHGSSLSTEDDLAAAELSVPCEDRAQLEWLSNFVEDSFSAGNVSLEDDENHRSQKDSLFRTSSPVSVLESSSCSGKTLPLNPDTQIPSRARSKRPRSAASFSPRPVQLIVSPISSETTTTTADLTNAFSTLLPSDFESFAESQPPKKSLKKKKKKKLPLPAGTATFQHSLRKCMHCEISKTPQWRAGPMGPKTLCNACGVRYKSGRLFPEYRPAASPTFVSSLHSNSHKKVLEMRVKSGHKAAAPTPEFVRKNNNNALAMDDYNI